MNLKKMFEILAPMKLLTVFLYHKSNKVFLHLVRFIVICVRYIRLCLMFRSDFSFIIKRIHLYIMDDHHGPHYEAVSAVLLLIRIASPCLQLKRCVIWSNTYAL